MYEPLKVTAYLQDGVATDASLPLDGILYHYAMREHYGAQNVTLSGAGLDVPPITLQLAKVDADTPYWFYRSSYAVWNGTVTEWTDHWNKRFDQHYSDLVDFRGKRGKVIIEQGAYKAYHMPIHIRHALSVSWYVHGDGSWIERMLRFISHIGKKGSQGDGAILRWVVEPISDDWSVYGPTDQLMRCIPSHSAAGLFVGYRPSYWQKENQTLCLVP